MQNHELFMRLALIEAQKAYADNEIPIGVVVVKDGQVIASDYNTCEADHSALSHAELKALRAASKLQNNWRLSDCDLYVTLEPCPMCLGALFQTRIRTLIIGCFDHKRQNEKLSAFPSLKDKDSLTDNNHTIQILGGILEKECAEVLRKFFKNIR